MNNIKNDKLYKIRLTMAHVMACAVKQIFEEVRFGIESVTEDGFYYDFELPRPLVPEDLKQIEEKIRDIINNGHQILNESISFDDASQFFSEQPYKLELINELVQKPENSNVSICRIGEFTDLCKGPCVASLKELNLKAFKLMRFSGAYWKGDAESAAVSSPERDSLSPAVMTPHSSPSTISTEGIRLCTFSLRASS